MGMLARGLRVWAPAVLVMVVLASCNTTKYLPPSQELLTKQSVRLIDRKNVPDRADVTYQLSTIAKQQPNGNFFLLWPREYFYLDNNKPKDTTSIDRFLRNTIGQEPAIYSDSLSRRSAAAMQDFMRYKGYLNARAYHEADRGRKRKVNLTYHVEAGERYLIDSVVFTSADPGVDSLLQASRFQSNFVAGEYLDLNNFDVEKARISQYLRNNGYAFFSGAYIDQLEVDTSRRQGYADVFFNVLPSQQEGGYRKYRVGEIQVFTDYDPLALGQARFRLDTVINNVRFLSNQASFRMRPELLRKNIYIEPGSLNSRADLNKTNLSLNGLGIYSFVRINQQIDTANESVLNYTIQLSPADRMSIGADLDLNYTNRNGTAGAGNLLGISVEPSFQNRNVLGGAELLTTSVRAGLEVNPSPNDNNPFFNTIDLAADISLNLPRFKDLGFYSLLNKIPAPYRGNIVGDGTLRGMREKASTRFSVGYEYLLIRQLFSYTIFNARFGYDYKASPITNYRINHLTIDVLQPTIEPEFAPVLDQNQRLQRSFGEQYFFSVLFRNLEINRAGRPDRRGRSVGLSGNFEATGLEVAAVNSLINAFREDDITLRPKSDAVFARYLRWQSSLRYNKSYTPQKSFATRFAFEIGQPFGGSQEEIPYVKQFFVGGANSMRAWAPRGLGPGGFIDPLSLDTDNNLFLYQTGDIRLEFNAEYRFPLFSFFRGAFFMDAGNVWILGEDPARPGSGFRFSERIESNILVQPFYRQIAVDAGFGLRVDLSYFIFRLDLAMPLRYNYPHEGDGTPLPRDGERFPESDYWRPFTSFRNLNLRPQLGLGYPF
ncbi:hypothetical protein A3850_002610 [Lewinella sp. 4G2]|nr:hypothetical protein A3850_002610 [Lewinella sp. 4G2]